MKKYKYYVSSGMKKQVKQNKFQKLIVPTIVILAMVFWGMFILNRLNSLDEQYNPPVVNSVLDGKISECTEKGGEHSFYYSNSKERYIFSCVVGGEVEDFLEIMK